LSEFFLEANCGLGTIDWGGKRGRVEKRKRRRRRKAAIKTFNGVLEGKKERGRG